MPIKLQWQIQYLQNKKKNLITHCLFNTYQRLTTAINIFDKRTSFNLLTDSEQVPDISLYTSILFEFIFINKFRRGHQVKYSYNKQRASQIAKSSRYDGRTMLARNLKRYREAKGLTQRELSQMSRLSPATIGEVERGRQNVTIDLISTICMVLEVPIRDMFSMPGDIEAEVSGDKDALFRIRRILDELNV